MGFFDRLFGRSGKETKFKPSAELMPEEDFWNLMARSRDECGGDPDFQEEALSGILHGEPLQHLITFKNRYHQLRGAAYTWPLWGAAYIINGGCSDDGFCYFRDWLISQGKEVYTQAVAEPEWLATLNLENEETEMEGMAYVADKVFEDRTGGVEMPAEFRENHEITGVEWSAEGDDLPRLLPKLCRKYDWE